MPCPAMPAMLQTEIRESQQELAAGEGPECPDSMALFPHLPALIGDVAAYNPAAMRRTSHFSIVPLVLAMAAVAVGPPATRLAPGAPAIGAETLAAAAREAADRIRARQAPGGYWP